MSKKIFATVALLVAVFVQFSLAAWDGTRKIPKTVTQNDTVFYEITSPEELVGFLVDLSAEKKIDAINAILSNDIVFGADTSKVMDTVLDIKNRLYWLDVFDGRGHTIYGYHAVHPLFNSISSWSRVTNLNIANSAFGNDTVQIAAAIAEHNYGFIDNVHLYNTRVRAVNFAGGIVAEASLSANEYSAYILNCSVNGGRIEGSKEVGGIVANASIPIMGCSNSATVRYVHLTRAGKSADLSVYVGGIVGFYGGSVRGTNIINCANYGSIELQEYVRSSYIGGIVGSGTGSLENVLNEGNIWVSVHAEKATDSAYAFVGGIAGSQSGASSFFPEIRDLLNRGEITASMDQKLAFGKMDVGGVMGTTEFIGISNTLNGGPVHVTGLATIQELYVGGVVGFADYQALNYPFAKLKNRGDIYAKSSHDVYVGGVVGWLANKSNSDLSLSQSFNYGSVTGLVSDSSSNAETLAVGGIAGGVSNVGIRDVYNRGNLLAKGERVADSSYVGGIVGYSTQGGSRIENAYNAPLEAFGSGAVGGIVGNLHDGGVPANVYFDGSLLDANGFGKSYIDGAECSNCKKGKAFMQGNELLSALNTANGTVGDRHLWVNRGDYPVLSFDSLYKNDSIFFDYDRIDVPPFISGWDSMTYTIYTPKQLEFVLEMAGFFYSDKKIKIELANDIVMGVDSMHLSKRKLATDMSFCARFNFEGNGHTIYGLNMDRAMFKCFISPCVFQNVTIANSRFENDKGLSAATVVLENEGTVRNVVVRNSFVRGGDVVGGVVANNIHNVLNVKNENTAVYSTNYAGGIAGVQKAFVENAQNSGKVSGRVAGGIVGYSHVLNGRVSKASNTGTVLGSGKDSVLVGGIGGFLSRFNSTDLLNTGLVEATAESGTVFAGGLVGLADSAEHAYELRNWGRVHVNGGTDAYAGGLVGKIGAKHGSFFYGPSIYFYKAFNYGPVVVKSVKNNAYAGGIAGHASYIVFQDNYNRGIVMNEGNASNKCTGGFVSWTEGTYMLKAYSFADTLTGNNVGSFTCEMQEFNKLDSCYVSKNLESLPSVAKRPSVDTSNVVHDCEAKTFEEMKVVPLPFLDSDFWVYGNCLPRFEFDTTSTCAANSVKDFVDTSFVDRVGYKEDIVYADSTDNPGDRTTLAKNLIAPLMQVEVSARNVTVLNVPGHLLVYAFDMQGRLVASVHSHGSSANLAVPRAGRYLIRCGQQARLVTVRR